MEYQAYISWLEEVPLYGHKDGIHNMEVLMKKMGNPQEAAPVIHVAGTNGKGSCCAMLAQILRESGYKVGLYTSPHLVEYTERIQVNGEPIAKEEWAAIGTEVKQTIEAIVAEGGNHATYFEIITAIAFCYFARQKVDVIVLETGVGGRLDATNVVEKPELCLITSVSLDHTKVLGNTLPQIAGEKAGIIKAGVPVILAENPPEVRQVVKQKAEKLKSPYHYSGGEKTEGWEMALVGDYQKQNLAAVICGVRQLQQKGWHITEETLRRGLKNTRHPGRMEQRIFAGKPLLLDGAHNPAGAKMLAQYLEKHYAKGSCVLIFSALAKKDVSHILIPLRDCAAIGRVIFTCIDGENQMEIFADIWQKGGESKPLQQIEKPERALEAAARDADAQQIVGAGSLYLVGEIEAILNKNER